jgi:hypothetical protein
MNVGNVQATIDSAPNLHARPYNRTTLDNMVLILLSLIVTVAMIAVAISMMRHRSSSGSLTGSGNTKKEFCISGEVAGQSATPSLLKPFLVVALPDGRIVTPTVAGQV